MATQFGTSASFGIPAAQTGIILESASYSYSQDSKTIRNLTGDTVSKYYYDERIEVSLSGFIPTSTPFSGTLASTITLATAPTDYLKGSVGSQTIIESVTRTHTVEDFQRIEISAMNHPAIV
jgi:hypothetical protein